MRRRELFDAILERPDDDDLRLVYADLLADEGDVEQSEFIQAEVTLARAKPDERVPHGLLARAKVLAAEHGARFAGPIAQLATDWRFERGLVAKITIDARTLAAHAEEIFAAAPAHTIEIVDRRSARGVEVPAAKRGAKKGRIDWAGLSGRPQVAHVRVLDARQGSLGDEEAVARILAGPHAWSRLEELSLGRDSTNASVRAIAAAHARLPALRVLRCWAPWLRGNATPRLGDDGVIALAASPLCPRLEMLEILNSDVGAAGAGALAQELREIRALSLAPTWSGTSPLGPSGARALATARGLGKLEVLQLGSAGIGDEGLTALAAAPWLANVRELDLLDNGLGDRGLRALAASPFATRLARLNLASRAAQGPLRNAFSDAALDELRASLPHVYVHHRLV